MAVACSSADETEPATTPVPKVNTTGKPRGLVQTLEVLKSDAQLRAFARAAKAGFAAAGDDLRSVGFRQGPSLSAMTVRLYPRAHQAYEVGLGESERLRVRIQRVGAQKAEVSLHDGLAYFADAYPSVDITAMATTERYEELLLLRDDKAPTSFRWSLELGAGFRSVTFEPWGSVAILDQDGRAAIRIPPAFVIDAKGTRRDASMRVEDEHLVVDVDPEGLSYPILLDPAFETAVWQLKSTTALPRARYGHSMVFHAAGPYILMHGGLETPLNPPVEPAYKQDTWTWAGSSWTQTLTSGPVGRRSAAAAYDANRQETVLFGGLSGGAQPPSGETWIFKSTPTPGWTQVCNASCTAGEKPIPVHSHAMTYDSGLKRVLLFGGNTGTSPTSNQMWEWNGATTKWIPRCNSGACAASKPPPSAGHAMAYDANLGKTVLFGGYVGPAESQATYTYDSTTNLWSNPSNSGPGARQGHTMTYNSGRKRVVLYGGKPGPVAGRYDDTWQWNGTAWGLLNPIGAPTARERSAMAYDSVRKEVVLFSGNINGVNPSDTHVMHVRGDACSPNGANPMCDSGFCVDGVCCDTASCGTCERCDTGGALSGSCIAVQGDEDPDTCTGTNTCNGSGVCKKKDGQTCSLGSECASAICKDGRCCKTACSGTCQTCANAQGACNPVTNADDPDTCTGANTCNGSSSCKLKNGQGCSAASACASNICKDGKCCATACTGVCKSCDNAAGTCQTVTNATDVDTCAAPNSCDATGQCKKQNGQSCGGGTECVSGQCVEGVCCDTACAGGCDACTVANGASQNGTCTVIASGSTGVGCGGFLCNGVSPACPTTCNVNTQCAATHYCSGGACVLKKDDGAACSATSECKSNFCVDGVCCNNACTDPCLSCKAVLKESKANDGLCGPTAKGTDPDSNCTAATPASCGTTGECDGLGGCQFYDEATSCGTTICVGDTKQKGQVCIAPNTCGQSSNEVSCAPYKCVGTACQSSCTTDSDCQDPVNFACIGSQCVAKLAAGLACNAGNECLSTFCADGVCCDIACNKQCEYCANAGSEGQCKAWTGAPKSDEGTTRPPCEGVGTACEGTCDGSKIDGCTYPAAGTACADASCDNDSLVAESKCDGAGKCAAGSKSDCGEYTCDPATKACKTTCSTNADCKAGAVCNSSSGTCASEGATCADEWTVKSASGTLTSCNGYRCVAGACQQQCSAASDCGPGFACEGSSCVPSDAGAGGASSDAGTAGAPLQTSDDEGGCGCRLGKRGSERNTWPLALIGLGLTLLGRRRRSPRVQKPNIG